MSANVPPTRPKPLTSAIRARHLPDRGRGRAVSGRIDARMCHDREKFVDARPGNGPHRRPLGEFGHAPEGSIVKWGILAMGVDENVRIDRDHAPRSL